MIRNYPILKLLVPYVLGVMVAYFSDLNLANPFLLVICTSGWIAVNVLCYLFSNYKWQRIFYWGITFPAFVLGILVTQKHYRNPLSDEQQNKLENSSFFSFCVDDTPLEKAKSVKISGRIVQDSLGSPLGVRAILYLEKSPAALNLQTGDLLYVNTHFSPIEPPKNPEVFDNQKFLRRKGIFYTSYIRHNNWVFLQHQHSQPVRIRAQKLQRFFSKVFADNGLEGDEYSVITAILLGNDDTMDTSLRSSYAAAGVSHILCVSGMHLGIIFMIVNFLLKPLDYSRRLQFLKVVLLLLSIWFYAQLTGLSPSVRRAATMFSFITIGGALRRPVNVFHSLFASLFILLLINPLLLFEIGFEMSYLAVFGIVLIQPHLVALYSPKTKVGNYFWELMMVSIAAQLATCPLSLHYFGQFPNYFLLTNLCVIALSFVVVVTGVVLLAISWFPAVSRIIGFVLTYEIRLLDGIVRGVESLPGSVTENLSVSVFQSVLLYGMIIFGFVWLVRRSIWGRYALLAGSLLLVLSYSFKKYEIVNSKEVTMYSLDKMSAVRVREGSRSVLFLDSAAQHSQYGYGFNIAAHERAQQVVSQIVPWDTLMFRKGSCVKSGDFFQMEGLRFFILQNDAKLYAGGSVPDVDYLYLRSRPRIPFSKLKQIVDFKEVIVDGKVSDYWMRRCLDSCAKYSVPCHSLRENGYLTIRNEF